MADDPWTPELHARRVELALKRRLEVARVLQEYGDVVLGQGTLNELSNMLFVVNVIIFGVVGWIALGYGLPAGGDTRPEWSIWLIWAPLGGLLFVGFLGAIAWQLMAHWLGGFIFDRRGRRAESVWWHQYLGQSESDGDAIRRWGRTRQP